MVVVPYTDGVTVIVPVVSLTVATASPEAAYVTVPAMLLASVAV